MSTLPNELFVNIFEFLPYWDLKLRIPRVCKHFKTLVAEAQSSKLDGILFRDKPATQNPFCGVKISVKPYPKAESPYPEYPGYRAVVNGVLVDSPIMLHPAFNMMTYRFTGNTEDMGFEYGVDGAIKSSPLASNSAARENAVTPAHSTLSMFVKYGPAFEINSGGTGAAVTVMDVMNAFHVYHQQDITTSDEDDEMERWMFSIRGRPTKTKKLSRDGFVWNGIQLLAVEKEDGVPCLYVDHFKWRDKSRGKSS